MKVAGIPFEEHRIPLYGPGSKEKILEFSPAGKVPCLIEGKLAIWDSLAICEYLAEKKPSLWPSDAAARAVARSVSAEMHSGFANLRTHMSMNIRKAFPRANGGGKGRTPEVLADIARIVAMWSDCRARFGKEGPYLFGEFSIADAMYAPIVLRFLTYDVEMPAVCRAYSDAMLALPAMREWMEAARAETETLPQFEPYG